MKESSITFTGAIPVIPQIREYTVVAVRRNSDKYLLDLRDFSYLKLPLSEKDLKDWCTLCNLIQIQYKEIPEVIEAVSDFSKRLVEGSLPARLTTDDSHEQAELRASIKEELKSEIKKELKSELMEEIRNEIQGLTGKMDNLQTISQGFSNQFDTLQAKVKILEVEAEENSHYLPSAFEGLDDETLNLICSKCTNGKIVSNGSPDPKTRNKIIIDSVKTMNIDTLEEVVTILQNARRVNQTPMPPIINRYMDHLSGRLDSIISIFERVEAKVNKLDAKVDGIDIKFHDQDRKIYENIVNCNKADRFIEALYARLDMVEEEEKKVVAVFTSLEEKERMMQAKVEEHDEKNNKVDDEINEIKKRLENAIEQSEIREFNRVCFARGRWFHPVPTLEGTFAPEGIEPFPGGAWSLHLPHKIQQLSEKDLDKWLHIYNIGEECRNLGFMRDISTQHKRAYLHNFIGGSSGPNYFRN